MKKKAALVFSLCLYLTGCSYQEPQDYSENQPKLDLRKYLNGNLEAWGIIFDYSGKQSSRFHVKMFGKWNKNEGELEEHFIFDDGHEDHRVWKISYSDDVNFIAYAHDVVGKAVGKQMGNAANMAYTLRVPRGDSSIDLQLDDWLYLIDENTIINRTTMKKFGFKVAELIVVFNKKND